MLGCQNIEFKNKKEISNIWSGNLLRVLDEVQEISSQLQNSKK